MTLPTSQPDIGQALREIRGAAGLTQATVGLRSGLPQGHISRFENGSTTPSLRCLARLLDACGQRLTVEAKP